MSSANAAIANLFPTMLITRHRCPQCGVARTQPQNAYNNFATPLSTNGIMPLIKCYGIGSDPQFAVSGYDFPDFRRQHFTLRICIDGSFGVREGAGVLQREFRLMSFGLSKRHSMIMGKQQVLMGNRFVRDGRSHHSTIVALSPRSCVRSFAMY